MKKPTPNIILYEERSGLRELEFYGFIIYCNRNKEISVYGNTEKYPFFHRSCAKPLQASIVCDLKTKEFFGLTDEEIAVCCASHTGEPEHINLLNSIMKKAGINEEILKCPVIPPLNTNEQKKFKEYSPLHNNCSGKHILMLSICKQQNWDTETYLEKDHPIQKFIYEKIQTLCETKHDLPYTPDGCTAPNWATPLENLALGFWNLFNDKKYETVQKAFRVNPHILGGENRLDTQLMMMNPKLSAKVGAGGLCYIANNTTKEVLGVKISDANMPARSIAVIEILNKIGWIDINSIDKKLLNNSLDKFVKTETGEIVGEYKLSDKVENFIRKF